jgi:predicted nucleic acid-binding Zn ribbon protein
LPKISQFNMPNMANRNKHGGPRIPATDSQKTFRAADSVKDLLARLTPTLTRVSEQANRQDFWRDWLSRHLPPDLAPHVSGVVEREDTLVIFADSAAWAGRLRYAALDMQTKIRAAGPRVQQVSVRVLPKS